MKIENGRIGELSYLNSPAKIQAGHDFYLIYAMKGAIQVQKDASPIAMPENTLLAVQSARAIVLAPQGICVLLRLSENYIALFGLNEYLVQCSPAEQNQVAYQKLVATLTELIDFVSDSAISTTDLLSKLTAIVEQIKAKFSQKLANDGDLIAHVQDYLSLNYQADCSLSDVAERFSVTPQYLSQRFKQQTGQNFAKYLTRLRLEHSLDDLKYSNDLILDIALKNGFASLSTFNRAFKTEYQLSPLQYRNQNQATAHLEKPAVTVNNAALEASLAKMRLKNLQQQTILLNAQPTSTSGKPTYVDTISLTETPTAETVKSLKRLRIKYVRLRLELPADLDNLSLLKINRQIEPVLKSGLPIIWVLADDAADQTTSLRKFWGYFANIISIDNVAKWKLEVSVKQLPALKKIKSALADLDLNLQFVISGSYEELSQLSAQDAAYMLVANHDQLAVLTYQAQQLRRQFSKTELSVLYPGITNDKLAKLNDTNFAAAAFLQSALKLSPVVDHLAIPVFQDEEGDALLDGQTGLVTYSLLRKPIFYAVSFFNRQSSSVLSCQDNYVASYDGRRDYSLLITNPSSIRSQASRIDYDNFHSILLERHAKKLVKIVNITNGNYLVKIRVVNRQVGLDKLWHDIGQIPKLNLEEQDYLSRKTAPDIIMWQSTVTDQTLQFQLKMRPDEIVYVHLIYLY